VPGDETDESFDAFVLERGERHLRVAVLITGDWHAAEDLPEAEVASLLGCTVGTVKTHASRGLRALRSRLGDQWPGTSGAEPPGDTARGRTIGRDASANGGQLAHCTTGLHA
jgi:DNA-directed RNA polymerase specialized sigma24 family protein